MKISKEWISFLREQYPKGSRIKLREMNNELHPVPPGTMGILEHIDDMGTFHMKWDDGRTLGLIVGEDSFTVLPPETKLMKLYMPLTVSTYDREYDEPELISSTSAVRYADNISAAIQRERQPEEAERGLMAYYGRDDEIDRKVRSYNFNVEVRNGKLWGVAECQIIGELTERELEILKDDITGQAADGFGEGFEQREIECFDGFEIYAHFWNWGEDWSIQTEEELFGQKIGQTARAEIKMM